jgi:hypothetical protein
MIPIEKLKQVSVIYTHGKCPDGLASAMILKDAFRMLGMDPPIRFLVHDTPEHRVAGNMDVSEYGAGAFALFCDIAPHPDVAKASGGQILVLDHHVGAKDLVESFGENGVYADAEKEPGVSGAVLAFREVWHPMWEEAVRTEGSSWRDGTVTTDRSIATRDFAECVGVRDCWRTRDPRFERAQWISKYLMALPADAWLQGHHPYLSEEEMQRGRSLFEQHMLAVKQTFDQKVISWIPDTTPEDEPQQGNVCLIVFQEQVAGFRLASDVAEMIRNDPELPEERVCIAGFSYVVDKPGCTPRLLFSLRQANGFDVCAFAKAQGGGGHEKAVGFSVDPHRDVTGRTPYGEIFNRLRAFMNP